MSGETIDEGENNGAYKQAGGHCGNFVFEGNKMTKKTKPSEVENYERIFRDDPKFKKLIPHFYGSKKGDDHVCHIMTENLLYGRENASYMDIKLGTSTCTLGASEEKRQRRLANDQKRCTAEHGYTIVACQLKNPLVGKDDDEDTNVNMGKIHPPTPDASKEWLKRLFSQKKRDGNAGSFDTKAVSCVLAQLEVILDYFQNYNKHTIRGMSLFVVVDSHKEDYLVKLIDLVSMEPTGKSDEGLIKGCQSFMALLRDMITEEERNTKK